MLLIKNGKVVTAAGRDFERGCVMIENGKIVKVDEEIPVPEGACVIDAEGHWVLPGLVDAHCHLGLVEVGLGFGGMDVNEKTDPVTPQLRAIDGINPLDPCWQDAVAGGVTCVATGPGSTNTIGGQFAVLKTHGDCVDEMVIKAPLAMKCAFGENLKRAYGDKGKAPMTRMGNASVLRETLKKAKEYAAKLEKDDESDQTAPVDMKMEALLPVMKREMPLKAHAHRADDILTAIRIAKEFDLKLTLEHCTEGHLIARHIAKAGFPAVTGPSFGFPGKHEVLKKSFKTPMVLKKAGVMTAIMTDHPVIPIERLNIMAGLAMKEGLSFEETLAMITINPAKILGLQDRVGSLEAGKDADVVIWSGNPLELMSEPLVTIIDGEIVYENVKGQNQQGGKS